MFEIVNGRLEMAITFGNILLEIGTHWGQKEKMKGTR
jgi:hypothetical protein